MTPPRRIPFGRPMSPARPTTTVARKPPHPATIVQRKLAHPATVQRRATPHPATIAQPRRAPPGPIMPPRPAHPARVPRGPKVAQRMESSYDESSFNPEYHGSDTYEEYYHGPDTYEEVNHPPETYEDYREPFTVKGATPYALTESGKLDRWRFKGAPIGVAMMSTNGPGDALRFIHAAMQWSKRNGNAIILAFVSSQYAKTVMGLCSGAVPHASTLEGATLYQEQTGAGALHWVVLPSAEFPTNANKNVFWGHASTPVLEDYLGAMFDWLHRIGVSWIQNDTGPSEPVTVWVPYMDFIDNPDKISYRMKWNVRFCRLDLCTELMETPEQLRVGTVRTSSSWPNPRVMLFLRDPGVGIQPERSTPWYEIHTVFTYLSLLCRSRRTPQLFLGGCSTIDQYLPLLLRIWKNYWFGRGKRQDGKINIPSAHVQEWRSDFFDSLLGNPKPGCCPITRYGYNGQSYLQQIQYFAQMDLAVGVNNSGLDLFAAAGVPLVREFEWKQARYPGDFYNTFLFRGPTIALNNYFLVAPKSGQAESSMDSRATEFARAFHHALTRMTQPGAHLVYRFDTLGQMRELVTSSAPPHLWSPRDYHLENSMGIPDDLSASECK